MKRNTALILLGAGAILCLILGALWPQDVSPLSLITQPFQVIGTGLRQLSLSGNAGNGFAILLYLFLSLLPLLFAAILYLKRKAHEEDSLLFLLSILLFIVHYRFINPAMLPLPQLPGMGAMLLGGSVYGLLLAWLILRLVRIFRAADEKSMLQSLRRLLVGLMGVLVFAVFFLNFSDFLGKIHSLQAGNTGTDNLGLSYLFLFLRYFTDSLPLLLEILVLLSACALFRAMETDRYSQGSLHAAQKLSHFCVLSLIITILSQAALSLLQLMLANHLYQIDMTLHFPLSDLILLLLALLLSRLLVAGKKLQDDNALFI